MPNIQGQKKWSEVRLLETHELARGGINGNLNEQAIALANRTEFLNQEKADKSEIIQGVFEFATYAEFNSAKANLPLNCTVVIGEENKTGSGSWGIGNNVWNGSVLKKSAFDPLQQAKVYLSKTGFGFIAGYSQSSINYVTATRTLEFTGEVWVNTNNGSYQLTTPQSVTLPAWSPYRLEYNIDTGLIQRTDYKLTPTEGVISLAVLSATGTTLKTTDFAFTVDGVALKQSQDGKLIATLASHIAFSNANSSLTISSAVRLKTSDYTLSMSSINPQDLVVSYAGLNGVYNLVFDTVANKFSFVLAAGVIPFNAVTLATVIFSSGNVVHIFGVDLFTSDRPKSYTSQYGKIIATLPSRVSFKNADSTLTIGSARIKGATTSIATDDIPAENRVISYAGLTGFYNLVFNLAINKFSFDSTSLDSEFDRIILGVVSFNSGAVVDVFGIDQYITDKPKTYDAHLGELIVSAASAVAIDTTAKTITLNSSVRVKSPIFTARPSTTTTISLPVNADVFNLIYDISTGTFKFVFAYNPQPANSVALATFYMGANSSIIRIEGLSNYTLNGQSIANVVYQGFLTANEASSLNFDFQNNKLIISGGGARLNYANRSILIAPMEIDITPIDSEGFVQRLIYNVNTGLFSVKRTSVLLSDGDIQVALFKKRDKTVMGVFDYYINGEKASSGADTVATADFRVPFGDLVANYVQPTLPEYKTLLDSFGADHTKIYDLYDALVAQFPDYVSKTVLGQDALGNYMHQYSFTSLDVNAANLGAKRPKIIIFSGVHGWEKAGTMNTYYVLNEICTRWKNDSKLEALRWGVDFVVVPVCNPSGYNASTRGTRQNHNGVDLARNFSEGWGPSDPSSSTYSGPSPMSEAETVLLDGVLNQNKDALLFISHHNFEGTGVTEVHTRGSFLWLISSSVFMQNVAKQHLIKATIDAKKTYEWIPQENDYYIGYADFEVPAGSEGYQAFKKYGIINSTFEICDRVHWEANAQKWSSPVATLGAQFLINWLLLTVKHGVDFYNSKINL